MDSKKLSYDEVVKATLADLEKENLHHDSEWSHLGNCNNGEAMLNEYGVDPEEYNATEFVWRQNYKIRVLHKKIENGIKVNVICRQYAEQGVLEVRSLSVKGIIPDLLFIRKWK